MERVLTKIGREWEGETVFVIAGGPSVGAQDVEALRGRKVIVVNSSYGRAPFAQFLFFADNRWWMEHRERKALKRAVAEGMRVFTVSKAATALAGGIPLHKLRRLCPNMRPERGALGPGLSEASDAVVAQRTSLQGAINMAVHLGAARIILLGADMGRSADGRSHHHDKHPWENRAGNKTWDIQMGQLALLVPVLAAKQISVINTSLESRIPWWTKAPLGDVLAGGELDGGIQVMPDIPKGAEKPARVAKPAVELNRRGNGYPGGIMLDDEKALTQLVKHHGAQSILEFGPGASTRIFLATGVQRIISCEHTDIWAAKARELYKDDPRVLLLKYHNSPADKFTAPWSGDAPKIDLAFVDSPQGYKPAHLEDGKARWNTLRFALQFAPVVAMHDAKRPGEQASLDWCKAQGYTVTMLDTQKGIAVVTR